MPIVEAREITKTYPAQSGRGVLLGRGGIASWFSPKVVRRQALAPLSLSVEPGESLGIIGRNGSGKSTLLKLIAGVSAPTTGTLAVYGRVASLLELGAGFHPMLTGRENIYLNAGLLGMRHAQTDACFNDIVAFSEIGDFIDQTVDTYSSGMYVRLAFSVAIHTDPDIFLVDEVLSVGDEGFQRKCRARILELKASGKTILFVSHDLGIVNTLCDRVILLDQGQMLSRGGAQATIDFYLRQIGRASAIHRLAAGDTEVVFNQGRLSLYHGQREITAPAGIKIQFHSMGHFHESTAAEWTLTKISEREFEAQGVLPRLPVTLYFRASIECGQLFVEAVWENSRPFDLTYAALHCLFPVSFTRWQFGAEHGVFPAIGVNDRQWTNVVYSNHEPGDCFLLEDRDGQSLAIRIANLRDEVPLQLDNTDYMAQARLAHVTEAIPSSCCPMAPGRRTLAALRMDCSIDTTTAERVRQAELASRTASFPGGIARMERGAISIAGDQSPISAGLHLHAQFKCGGIWTLSHGLHWEGATITGGCVSALGRSTRLPFAVAWSMASAEDSLHVDVALLAEGLVDLDEFNISLELSREFMNWQSPDESGRFVCEETLEAWQHLNTRYTPGNWIRASAATPEQITLHAGSPWGTLHPTAILAGKDERRPVLQILCSPGQQGRFTLQSGRHPLFSARVVIGSEPVS